MKTHLLTTAALALSVFVAAPAAAQVSGIAIADPAIALASAQARQTADAQIATTFQAQRTQLEQLQQQRATALRQFDTDGDGQLNEAEQTAAQANTAAVQYLAGLGINAERYVTRMWLGAPPRWRADMIFGVFNFGVA